MTHDENTHPTAKARLHELRAIIADKRTHGDVSDLDLLLKLRDDLEREERIEREAIEADRRRTEEADAEVLRRQREREQKLTTMGDD